MRITDIQCDPAAGLVRLCTDGPHQGLATGLDAATAAAIDAHYRPLLADATPWERERLWQALKAAGRRAGLAPATWGLVDIALWDLLGKAQDLPVFRAIGGFRDRVPAYLCGGDAKPEAAARRARDAGFWGYKFTVDGHDDPATLAHALRRAVGDDFRLLCDASETLDLEAALALGRALDDIDAHWYEEPLADRDLTGLQKLADALDLPVVAGAFAASIQSGTRALTTRAVDRLRFVLPTAGGITDALKLARGAEALGMNCEIDWHRAGTPHAAAHVLGAIRNAEFFAADGLDGPLPVIDGEVHLPLAPGLGLSSSAS